MVLSKTTIIISKTTRDKLKRVARKDQTYDHIIQALIESSNRFLRSSREATQRHEKKKEGSSASLEPQTLESKNPYS